MRKIILYIEDDGKIQEAVATFLRSQNFEVIVASTGATGINELAQKEIDLVLLDLMLPDMAGEDVCSFIKANYNVPVIMVTAKVDEDFVVNGFKIGTDDYIKKPFSLNEMLARIQSLLQRKDRGKQRPLSFNSGALVVDFAGATIVVKEKLVHLTQHEFQILKLLITNSHKVFNREMIIRGAFGFLNTSYERTMDSHIKNIRLKIEDNPRNSQYIMTVRGLGYKFIGEADEN
ncbi:MAG: response regulator transcription factor [Culicoidibacterales bacterium]